MTFLNEEIWDLDKCRAHVLEILDFLRRYKWLVSARPIDIVANGTLDEHADILDVLAGEPLEKHKLLLQGHVEDFWPDELKSLVVGSTTLAPPIPKQASRIGVAKSASKKEHETYSLSALVGRICRETPLKGIVDVGSGLGYVDRALCRSLNDCSILAIESEEARCATADALNRNVGFGDRIVQFPKKLHSDNVNEVAAEVAVATESPCCIIALHACGDLSVTAMRLFEEASSVRSAVIVPCCYHKMASSLENGDSLRSAVAETGDLDLCNVSFLRLAAESSREMWLNRDSALWTRHARSVLYRALVRSYEEKRNIVFRKRRRKAVKSTSTESWSGYAASWAANALATCRGTTVDEATVERELRESCTEEAAKELVEKTLGYNTLRNVVQNVAESFVLLDRLTLMKERNRECFLAHVADPSLSPRSVAIVARK